MRYYNVISSGFTLRVQKVHIYYEKVSHGICSNISGPQKEKEIQDREQLLSTLRSASAAIQVITVDKRREQYFWPREYKYRGGRVGGAVIEHTRIHRPELVTSVSIEHENLDKVNSALKYLQLPSQSMKVLGYLDCLECWAFRRNCFKDKN